MRGGRSAAAAAVCLCPELLRGSERVCDGRGEWGMLRWRAGRRRRLERTGWQASGWMSEGDKSGRQARGAVGVCVSWGMSVVCVCLRGGGGGSSPFLKTGRSRCLALCEAPARARVEGGESLPRLSHSLPSTIFATIAASAAITASASLPSLLPSSLPSSLPSLLLSSLPP